jgi:hypothetical protein
MYLIPNNENRLILGSYFVNIYDEEAVNFKVYREKSQVVYEKLIRKTKKKKKTTV